MNHLKLYNKIISYRLETKPDGYVEKHHIVPSSLGGLDDQSNIVILTAREHFICHYLLVKMYKKESFEWYKMMLAFKMMKCDSLKQGRYINSRLYESLRRYFSNTMSEQQTGKNNSQYGKMWIHNPVLKKNRKISKYSLLPVGWIKGRKIKWNKKLKKCKRCGQESCMYPDICGKYKLLNAFITYFNFNPNKIGTLDFYDEFNRVVKMLDNDYNSKGMSVEDITLKYKITSNERMRKILRSLSIDRRSSSDARKNYLYKK